MAQSERTENIVALTVFAIIILAVLAVLTRGFGLFEPKLAERVAVPLGSDPYKGPQDAKVVIVVYSDYECPYCRRAEATLNAILPSYEGKVGVVFKDYPLVSIHEYAFGAAQAAECAKEQGKFWEYHDILFSRDDLSSQALIGYAEELELDTTRFEECLKSERYSHEVFEDLSEGQKIGVSSTPTFFVNGRPIVGAQPAGSFITIIEEELESSN